MTGARGRAIVANDMHLGLSTPNIWYRVSMVWSDKRTRRPPLVIVFSIVSRAYILDLRPDVVSLRL